MLMLISREQRTSDRNSTAVDLARARTLLSLEFVEQTVLRTQTWINDLNRRRKAFYFVVLKGPLPNKGRGRRAVPAQTDVDGRTRLTRSHPPCL